MMLEEFKNNLEKCSKTELIEMICNQWLGLGEFIEQFKMVPKENNENL